MDHPPAPPAPGKPMEHLLYQVKQVIVGQDQLLERLVVALLARGHILVDGRPAGTGDPRHTCWTVTVMVSQSLAWQKHSSTTTSALLAAATVLPLLVITLRNVRRGTWTNFDVSDRGQRGGLYYAAVPLTLLGAGVMYAVGAPPAMVRGTLIVGGLLLAALLLSPFLKAIDGRHRGTGWGSWQEVPLATATGPAHHHTPRTSF